MTWQLRKGGADSATDDTGSDSKDPLDLDPINNQRREKVKEAMLHAWNSYEKYAWGQDELQVCFRCGINIIILYFFNISFFL